MPARRHPCLVSIDPIFGDALLRFRQRHFTPTHHFVHDKFEFIFLFCRPFAVARLRPEVLRIGGVATDVERYQMV